MLDSNALICVMMDLRLDMFKGSQTCRSCRVFSRAFLLHLLPAQLRMKSAGHIFIFLHDQLESQRPAEQGAWVSLLSLEDLPKAIFVETSFCSVEQITRI